MRISLPVTALLSLIALPLAQAEPISADRPGYSPGTSTVSPGHYNIELGFQGESGSRAFPLTNLRVGVTATTEVEVQWGGWSFANSKTTVNNLSLGGKYRLLDEDTLKLSLLGLLALPSGNGNASGSKAAPQVALLWSYSGLSAAGLFGMVQLASSNQGALQTQAQAAIGASFSHSDHIGSYVELFSDTPLNHGGSTSAMLDGGYTYLLDASTQLDLHLGLDLNGNSANFVGLGFARSY